MGNSAGIGSRESRVGRAGTRAYGVVVLALLFAGACGRQKQAAETGASTTGIDSAKATAAITGDDPCRYLVPSDVEPYTGPLASPPYRASSGDAKASRSGDACLYRGKDGREVLVTYMAHGGATAGTVARRVPAVMDRIVGQAGGGAQSGAESQGPAAAIMGPVGPGPWDNSNWFPTGTLMVYKGDASFVIDMSATSGGKDGAIDLATKAIGRLGQPLDYDGASAVASAPKPVPRVAACDLIPRARAEGILGTLSSAPKADADNTTCTYTVTSTDGDVNYPVAITWGNGYKQLNMLKHSMSSITGALGAASKTFNVGAGPAVHIPSGGMPDMPALDPSQQKMFKAFTKAVGLPGMNGVAKRGMRTDSSLVGPWDSAALVNGTWLIASKHDVAVMINVGDADYDKAKALLAAACEQL
jgi:hypothetical protein